ncbi:hypothetical protein BDE18_4044 [Paracoccus pantotrophus]|uniref:Uncharacterized protein n=1 Tax=Paracoccus pantotrophus TaxID=82367 RepID=A0ABX9S8J0_PARPN|nr:hypothetical protein BDE18_4044 [Paracoccus pantotrophus]SFO26055.1 hypothetical protein SAMN04244567_01206 [Paracoccus pantotrophus]
MAARRAPGRLGKQRLARRRRPFAGVARDDGQRADADADLRPRLGRRGGKRRFGLAGGTQRGAGRHRARFFGRRRRGFRPGLCGGVRGLGRGGPGGARRGAGYGLRRGRLRGGFPRQGQGRGPCRFGRTRRAQPQPFGRRGKALGVGGQARRFRRGGGRDGGGGRGGVSRRLRAWRGRVAKALQRHPRGEGGRWVAAAEPGRGRRRLGWPGLGQHGLGPGCGSVRTRLRRRLGPGGGQGRPCRCRAPFRFRLAAGRRCRVSLCRPGPRCGRLGLRCRPGRGWRWRGRARRQGGRHRGQGRGLFDWGDRRGLGCQLRPGGGAQPGLGIACSGDGTDQRCQPGRTHHGSSVSARAARMRRR